MLLIFFVAFAIDGGVTIITPIIIHGNLITLPDIFRINRLSGKIAYEMNKEAKTNKEEKQAKHNTFIINAIQTEFDSNSLTTLLSSN